MTFDTHLSMTKHKMGEGVLVLRRCKIPVLT